ncbi:MAG: coproporphyrinogen dehydrogenase HemZ [Clostridia bacterium]|nr:coproporphyrinogen dehydrogenase HemZ [Clostridia bacterium]
MVIKMKLILSGEVPINRYYVQMLCMIYFPGVKFSENENAEDDGLALSVSVFRKENAIEAECTLSAMGKEGSAKREREISEGMTLDRATKLAIGAAMLAVGEEMLSYKPSWGMLIGVRPSKVAMERLLEGNSKTKVRKMLRNDYFVTVKKAALATDVALAEREIIGNPDKKDCSVYISIPFCPTRCAYCSFVSYTSKKLLSLIPEYLIRLCHDIEKTAMRAKRFGLNVKTIYIGGGTPTILDAYQLEILLSKISECFDVSSLEEYTLEAGRPDTIDAEKLAVAAKYGVTRMSVNPQTLCDNVLSGVGRNHTADEFYRAYDIARKSGIKYINTDLIAGLPGDTFKTFSASFDRIVDLSPDNITVHTFCVKKSADLMNQGPSIFSRQGGDAVKCVDYSQLRAMQAGYKPYYMYRQKNTVGNLENVGFAKPGSEGLYNIYMMEEVHTILAAGAGAVTKLVEYKPAGEGTTRIKRLFSPKYPFEYLKEDNNDEITRAFEEFFAE